MRLDELDDLARRNHGVVSRAQSGLSEDAWRRAIRAGTLVRVHSGVARLVGTANTPEQRIAAAVSQAVRAHWLRTARRRCSGAVPRPEADPVDIIVPDRRACASSPASWCTGPVTMLICSRRSGDRTSCAPTSCAPCVTSERWTTPARSKRSVTRSLARLVTLGALEVTLIAHARPGRHGVRALRRAIDVWSIDARARRLAPGTCDASTHHPLSASRRRVPSDRGGLGGRLPCRRHARHPRMRRMVNARAGSNTIRA